MNLDFSGVNWVGIIVAVIVSSVIGFVWFLPQVFGARLAAVTGGPPRPARVPPATIVSATILRLVMAYVLALVIVGLRAVTVTEGAIVGFVVWLGFAATTLFAGVLWEGRPVTYWVIVAGNELIGLVVMGAVLAYIR